MPCQCRDSYISPNSLTPRLLTNLFCLTQGLISEALAMLMSAGHYQHSQARG